MNRLQGFSICFFIMVILLNNSCFAIERDTIPDKNQIITSPYEKTWIIKSFLQDEKKIWGSVFKPPDLKKLYWIPVIGATVFSICYDEEIYARIKHFQSGHPWVSDISPVITLGGDNLTVVSVCGLFYLGGIITHSDKAKQTGLMTTEALLHAGFVVSIGKLASGRQRPSFDQGKDHWSWFPASLKMYKKDLPKSAYDAFPSGHTIAAWSVATVIARQYRDIKWIPPLCYLLATGVGLSRITEDTHWLSDVILGGALGYGIGRFVVNQQADSPMTLFPSLGPKALSLNANFRF